MSRRATACPEDDCEADLVMGGSCFRLRLDMCGEGRQVATTWLFSRLSSQQGEAPLAVPWCPVSKLPAKCSTNGRGYPHDNTATHALGATVRVRRVGPNCEHIGPSEGMNGSLLRLLSNLDDIHHIIATDYLYISTLLHTPRPEWRCGAVACRPGRQ